MTIKDSDRRRAFWISFVYICVAPILVKVGFDTEMVKTSAMALTTLGIANYFSKPSGEI